MRARRADSTHGADAADLLLEASELSRSVGDDARSTALLRKARGVDPSSSAARNALLALPGLPPAERVDLLLEEARQTIPERAAALHAERAAVLDIEGRIDEAVQACAQALALAGVDLAVLRRLARVQLRRGDHSAAHNHSDTASFAMFRKARSGSTNPQREKQISYRSR